MAAISLVQGHDLSADDMMALYAHCKDLLPSYSCPHFVRVQQELEITFSFKQRKLNLVKEGFDPEKCHGEPLFYLDNNQRTYAKLDKAVFEKIMAGDIRY